MHKRLAIITTGLFFLAASFTGCASKWAPESILSTDHLLWLDNAKAPLIEHAETITGFKPTNTTASNILRLILFGRNKEDTEFRLPVAVSAGRDGRIAIADMGGSCVHLYVPAENKYQKIIDAGSKPLKTPVGVAFDDDLRLYISDSTTGAVQVYDASGAFLLSLTTAGDAPLRRPTGMSYSSVNRLLYVADTLANRIHAFEPGGVYRFSFGSPGERSGQFNYPTHVTVAPDGKVYVVDAMNFRVQIFDPTGKFLSSFGHHGNGSGDLAMPKGIAVDSAGVIYIVDTLFDTVQFFNARGDFLFTIGGRGTDQGQFSMPSGAFLDSANKLYVCDAYNRRVQIFQVTGSDSHE